MFDFVFDIEFVAIYFILKSILNFLKSLNYLFVFFWKKFEKVWKKFEKSLRKVWKKFESLKNVWKKFEKSLKKVWEKFESLNKKKSIFPKFEIKFEAFLQFQNKL